MYLAWLGLGLGLGRVSLNYFRHFGIIFFRRLETFISIFTQIETVKCKQMQATPNVASDDC